MMRLRVVVIVAAIGLLAQCGGDGDDTPSAPTTTQVPQPTGDIRVPEAGRTVTTASLAISGTYRPTDMSEAVWLFVFPDMAPGVGFPQSENRTAGTSARKQNGQWEVTATFGGPPQGYTLEAYAAGTSDNNTITTHLRSSSSGMPRAPSPGVTSIPSGLRLLGSPVRVSRGPLAVITDPGDGAVVPLLPGDIVVRGVFASDLSDEIWVLVWPELAPGLGYPQSPDSARGLPATRDSNRLTWSVPVTLGGPAQAYDIRVYTADTAASNALGAILARWVATNNYPGLRREEIPTDVHEQQKITIRKR